METLVYVPNVTDVSAKNIGLNQHLTPCYLKNKFTAFQTPHERKEDEANNQTSDDSKIEIQDISTPSLRYK